MHRIGHAAVTPPRLTGVAQRCSRRLAAGAGAALVAFSWLLPIPVSAGAIPTPPSTAANPSATTSSLHLRVESARGSLPAGLTEGDAIPRYQWLITRDDTGDPTHYGTSLRARDTANSSFACTPQRLGGDPAYPASCRWPSIRSIPGGTTAEVVAQGDQSTFSEAKALSTLPRGSYMISVAADGYDVRGCAVTPTVTCHVDGFTVGGAWFTVPAPHPGLVTVALQPYPLALATIRARVWNDLQTDGAYETGEPALAGFTAKLTAIGGPILSDWFGNPLCTTYQRDSAGRMLFASDRTPIVLALGGTCASDANGDIVIPYMVAQRYSVDVVPPDGQTWYRTTVREGWPGRDAGSVLRGNGIDAASIEGSFPPAELGFVQVHTAAGDVTRPFTGTGTGTIKGTVLGTLVGSVPAGGVPNGGAQGSVVPGPADPGLVSLVDTNQDETVYVGRGNPDGTFQINGVPDSDYVLYSWDEDQASRLTGVSVSVKNGQVVDLGNIRAPAWWARIHGRVCSDANRNGRCEADERGIPGLVLNLLGRDNSHQPPGDSSATTGADGSYAFPRAYPLGQFVVEQGDWEHLYTVGVTYQAINQPAATTEMAHRPVVDVSTLNAGGTDTRVDWAVHTYETDPKLGPTNGGIIGEDYYNSVRIEPGGRFQTIQPSEPGIPGFTMHAYWPVKCNPATGAAIDPAEPFTAPAGGTACTLEKTPFGSSYYLTNADTASPDYGAMIHGPEAAHPYSSETWHRPVDCTARDADGTQVVEQVLPPSTGGHDCLEAPLMGSQVGSSSDTARGAEVNGNYRFTEITTDVHGAALAKPIAITQGDWIVAAGSPLDVSGNRIWRPSLEEDVNGYAGDAPVAPGETPVSPPQPVQPTAAPGPVLAIPPFACVGALHTVHLVDTRKAATFDPGHPATTSGIYNPGYIAAGGSPYEGTRRPLCDARLVTVRNGRSAAASFAWIPQTRVPLPSRVVGLVVGDLDVSSNPKELRFGEKPGIPNLPIGIYDVGDRLVRTIGTDPNGMFEVELPSMTSADCASRAVACPALYRYVANDPGQPGAPNASYNPAYGTVGAFFESWPGTSGPADPAPAPAAMAIELPGTTLLLDRVGSDRITPPGP